MKHQEIRRSKAAIFLNWVPSVSYMVLIFIFSHKEPLLVSVAGQWSFHGIDKIAHFCEFFLLFFLLFRTLYLERYKNPELKSLCFSVFYSISDEFHQSFLPYRDCELGDVMADTSGVLAGFILLLLYKKYRGKETLLSRQLIES